jgi:hypothetical protein
MVESGRVAGVQVSRRFVAGSAAARENESDVWTYGWSDGGDSVDEGGDRAHGGKEGMGGVKRIEMNGMGWDGMGWSGVEWDGFEWHGME